MVDCFTKLTVTGADCLFLEISYKEGPSQSTINFQAASDDDSPGNPCSTRLGGECGAIFAPRLNYGTRTNLIARNWNDKVGWKQATEAAR